MCHTHCDTRGREGGAEGQAATGWVTPVCREGPRLLFPPACPAEKGTAMSVVTITVLDTGDGGGWGGHVCARTSVRVCSYRACTRVQAGTRVHARVRSSVGSPSSKPTPPQAPRDVGIMRPLWARLIVEQQKGREAGWPPHLSPVFLRVRLRLGKFN